MAFPDPAISSADGAPDIAWHADSAEAAARYNNANRIKDEAELVDFFKAQGLKVITPDVAAFRKTVQEKYLKSDMAKVWPKGLLERINAVQ